jgi:hypothetical protein
MLMLKFIFKNKKILFLYISAQKNTLKTLKPHS